MLGEACSLPARGKVVTADAMHTQTALARFLVEDKGADYVFTVKDNQSLLRKALAASDWELSPPVHGERKRPRPD
jgi:predicted transposase YbfD/YdcC